MSEKRSLDVKHSRGWTLIELALVISLMAIVSTVALRLYANPLTFKHYTFSQKLIESIHQAKMVTLFSSETVTITMIDENLIFSVNGSPQSTWSVHVPKGVQFDHSVFPLSLGQEGSIKNLTWVTLHHRVVLEPRTIYAYQISKTP